MKTPATRGRIGIVFPFGFLDTVPSLCDTAVFLARRGYNVDFLTYASRLYEPARFDDPRIEVRVLRSVLEKPQKAGDPSASSPPAFTGLARRVLRLLPPGAMEAVRSGALIRQLPWLLRKHRQSPYRCLIGVDPEGLRLASQLSRILRVPFAYLSLELLLSGDLGSSAERRTKAIERSLIRQARFIVIQDEARAALLEEDNQVPARSLVLLSNSPLGPARRQPARRWHERFGLSPDRRVVLHAGSIEPWTDIDEIVEGVAAWPEPWVLVVHTKASGLESRLEALQARSAAGRVYFSTQPVPRDQFEVLIDSADVGIALYKQGRSSYTRENIRTIGLSSGKTAYYTRAGLPVILSANPFLQAMEPRVRWAEFVTDGRQAGAALSAIAADYEAYSEGAMQVFDSHFDLQHGLTGLLQRLDGLGTQR